MMGTSIDHCSDGKHQCTDVCKGPVPKFCITCRNVGENGYECVCPANYDGDGRHEGTGCNYIVNNGTKKYLTAAAVVVALIVTVVLYCNWSKRRRNDSRKTFSISLGYELPDFTKFTYIELSDATNSFDQCRVLGKGGQGTVYQGYTRGCMVAVKKCRIEASQIEEVDDKYKEFVNETRLLGEIRHENIVRVLGYCIASGHGYIVYELIKNGSLHDLLHDEDNRPVPWITRLEIAVGIAAALKYLHFGTAKVILHRDIKSSNILLDENCKSKLADFGISRSMREGATHIRTGVKGTPGYLAPENYESKEQRVEGDVYSFGVVLGEILTRKKVKFKDYETGQMRYLNEYLRSLNSDTMIEALDKELYDDRKNRDNILIALELAQQCCTMDRALRPRMTRVYEVLSHMRLSRDYQTAKQSFTSTSSTSTSTFATAMVKE